MTSWLVMVCLIVGISDGDTMTGRCETGQGVQAVKLRLAEIDAPEKRQPYGTRSRQHLALLCFGRPADVRVVSRDRYGRMVARVRCGEQDASLAQVRTGMAWAFTRYLTDPAVSELERAARAQQLGLWSDPAPVAPWEFRQQRRASRGR